MNMSGATMMIWKRLHREINKSNGLGGYVCLVLVLDEKLCHRQNQIRLEANAFQGHNERKFNISHMYIHVHVKLPSSTSLHESRAETNAHTKSSTEIVM